MIRQVIEDTTLRNRAATPIYYKNNIYKFYVRSFHVRQKKMQKCKICGTEKAKIKGMCRRCYCREYKRNLDAQKREIAYLERLFWRQFKVAKWKKK